MSAWAAISNKEILEVLKDYQILNEAGKVKSKRDPTWKTICATWKNRKRSMKPVALYFYMLQNRNNALNDYKKTRENTSLNTNESTYYDNDDCSDQVCDSSDSSSDSDEYIVFEQNKNHPAIKANMSFCVVFEQKEWSKIGPHTKIDTKGQSYYALKKGWSHALAEHIWQEQKLPCAFSFKSAKIRCSNEDSTMQNIKVNGICKDELCRAVIYGECKLNPEKEHGPVTFHIQTLNTKKIPHQKRRHVLGAQRANLKSQLLNKKPVVVKRQLVEEYMNYGDEISPLIPSDGVLKKIRQEAKDEELGVTHSNIWESFENLYTHVEFSKAIRQLGFQKFFLFYWTPEQIDIYNDLIKLNPIVSIDATGSIAKKIMRAGNYLSGHIFLYVIVTYIGNIIVPVCQLLSEKHDTLFLQYWISEFFKSGASIPKEIVTDMSAALQNAVSLATNNMNYKTYLSTCYLILIGKSQKLPKCFIGVDIAHLMNCAARLKSLSQVGPAIKDFYLRCIGFISTINDFPNFKSAATAIFTVAQNRSKCTDKVLWLIKRLETFKFDDDLQYKEVKKYKPCSNNANDCADHTQCNIEIKDSDTEDSISNFINNIIQETCFNADSSNISSSNFEDNNFYCCPTAVRDLKRLLSQFPAWTNIMRKHYNSPNKIATSARSEAYFCDFKSSVLDDRKPCRSDKLFIKHVRSIDSVTKLARATYNNQKELQQFGQKQQKMGQKLPKANKNVEERRILCAKENWRNKASDEHTYTYLDNISMDSYTKFAVANTIDTVAVVSMDHTYSITKNNISTDNSSMIPGKESNCLSEKPSLTSTDAKGNSEILINFNSQIFDENGNLSANNSFVTRKTLEGSLEHNIISIDDFSTISGKEHERLLTKPPFDSTINNTNEQIFTCLQDSVIVDENKNFTVNSSFVRNKTFKDSSDDNEVILIHDLFTISGNEENHLSRRLSLNSPNGDHKDEISNNLDSLIMDGNVNFAENSFLGSNTTLENSLNLAPIASSTVKSLQNISLIANSENNFSIIIEPEVPIEDRVAENQKLLERNNHHLRKRGKYVSACPDVRIVHQKPKGTKISKKIIFNGHRLPPRIILGSKIALRNTCAFDSVIEVVTTAFRNTQKFEDFVTASLKSNHPNCFLSAMITFARNGPIDLFYSQRAKILHSICATENYTMDCQMNVCSLFHHMMNNYDATVESEICSNQICKAKKSRNKPVINIGAREIWNAGIQCLEKCVISSISQRTVYCRNCKQTTAQLVIKVGPYLCINTENIYEGSIASFSAGKQNEEYSSNLKEIPTTIDIRGENYVLCGAIRFISPQKDGGIGHYIAYTRTINNTWREIDDLRNTAKYFENILPDIKIALLLYAHV